MMHDWSVIVVDDDDSGCFIATLGDRMMHDWLGSDDSSG